MALKSSPKWMARGKWALPVLVLAAGVFFAQPQEVRAQMAQCLCVPHDPLIKTMKDKFHGLRDFITDGYFKQKLVTPLQHMAENLSAVGAQQTVMVGTLLDAKQQLETQRDFQALKFEAHKDYQPDESFCAIGTSARSLAASARQAELNLLAMNRQFMDRLTGKPGMAGAESGVQDLQSRWGRFKDDYCDPQDNGWGRSGEDRYGLEKACGAGGSDPERVNRDVDFVRFIENARTLDVDFTDNVLRDDEEDVLALGNNLYTHNLPQRNLPFLNNSGEGHQILPLRSVMAKRNVARHSYDAIVAMKSAGTGGSGSEANSYAYLGAALRDLGMSLDEIEDILGDDPSYFAQLEVLAKRLYQSPNFIAALYDSPANTARKKAALNAIELLLDRAIYESEMRQEMVLSVLLATDLNKSFTAVAAQGTK